MSKTNCCNRFKTFIACITLIGGTVVGVGTIVTLFASQAQYGKPNSVNGDTAVMALERASIMLSIAAIIGLMLLLCSVSHLFIAIVYFLFLFMILVYCSIAFVRAQIWLYSSTESKISDIRSYTNDLYETKHHISEHFSKTQNELHCCGVRNYTDWFGILSRRSVPDSCCTAPRKHRKCGLKAFLELDSLVAFQTSGSGYVVQLSHAHFQRAKLKIPFAQYIPPEEVVHVNMSFINTTVLAAPNSLDPCDPALANQVVFFYLKKSYTGASKTDSTIDPAFKYTFRAINTRELCHSIRFPNSTDEEYEKWSFVNRNVLFTEGCSSHLIEYTNQLCLIVSLYTPVLGGVTLLMMYFVQHVHWENRKSRVASAHPPFWFEDPNPTQSNDQARTPNRSIQQEAADINVLAVGDQQSVK